MTICRNASNCAAIYRGDIVGTSLNHAFTETRWYVLTITSENYAYRLPHQRR